LVINDETERPPRGTDVSEDRAESDGW